MSSLGLFLRFLSLVAAQASLLYDPARFPNIPSYGPQPNPPYMVDNQYNYFKVAPDRGEQNGPVWLESGSFETYMLNFGHSKQHNDTSVDASENLKKFAGSASNTTAASSYWLPKLAPLGQPLAGAGYKFYRDVVEYGADNTGETDATEAINAAIGDGKRCGLECGNTFVQGAIIYFPPGTYKICRPVIQLYYTQFIGDALNPPTIKGCDTFQGIALFDTDPYVPGGNGQNWYINQNQFFRQIRNFIFDLTEMPLTTDDNDQPLVPTGIHWQVSQACSLQNLVFNMPEATDDNKVTHVGIFMENGSGGFVSDLEFNGGNIGWRAGSQQYTAMNLKFNGCLTAVQMIWSWGFNWQRIEVDGGAIAFNISGRGGSTGQGIGSVSIIDSWISNCPIAILTNTRKDGVNGAPNIVIDNLAMYNVGTTVQSDTGDVILKSTDFVKLWAIGRRYNGYNGTYTSGEVDSPKKGSGLLDINGKLFYQPRPQYEDLRLDQFLIATEHGCKNDGTGDNTAGINSFLEKANKDGKVAYFPAGIYRVGGTVVIPTGSRVQGASWSQIQGAGFYFNDLHNPRVVVQVGERGDVGSMEIVDMMFTTQGATAGAIVVEWNVHQDRQGSAAMWDSHVRVGGALGTDLDVKTCPKFGFSDACICASLLFHVTPQASGYFENVWIWLADHDNDMSVYDSPDKLSNQISLYAARGTLIESEGPSWFYGTGSEHTVMYQYQLYGAKNIYLGHIQTETPYYQPVPIAPLPFDPGKEFPGDPSFEKCKTSGCQAAWGLRIINSKSITLHSSGLYSFFQEYYQDCVPTHNCQERSLEVRGSKDVALFNIFTVGMVEIGTGINHGAVFQNDSNQSGFTTEVSVWLPLPGDDEYDIVYVGPEVYEKPSVTCPADCILVFPTSSLSSRTIIDPGKYTTSLEYGHRGTTTISGREVPTFYTTVTTITLAIDPIITDGMPYSNINITEGQTSAVLTVLPSVDIPPVPVPMPDGEGKTTTRNVTVPPWPDITRGPPESWSDPNASPTEGTREGVYHTPFVTTVVATRPTVSTISFSSTVSPIVVKCPPNSKVPFNTPKTTPTINCRIPTTVSIGFTCPATKVVTFIGSSTGVFTVDCTVSTTFTKSEETITPGPTNKPTTTQPLPVWSTWPPRVVTPIEEEVKKPEPGKTPCKLWFFSFCLNREKGETRGLRWILPPGIYPPGPPPPHAINLPSWTIKSPLPPWPPITVGRDNIITYPQKEPTKCEIKSASICATTVFKTTTTRGTITSTASSTSSTCDTIYGCSASDWDKTTTRTKPDNCPSPTAKPGQAAARPPIPPWGCPANALVYPSDMDDVRHIRELLAKYEDKYVEVKSEALHFTLFFWIPYLDQDTMNTLVESPDVADAFYYEHRPDNDGILTDLRGRVKGISYNVEAIKPHGQEGVNHSNDSVVAQGNGNADQLMPPTLMVRMSNFIWDLSQISMPRGMIWKDPYSATLSDNGLFMFHYDGISGDDQYIYIMDEDEVAETHPEMTHHNDIEYLRPDDRYSDPGPARPDVEHGTGVASKVIGRNLGSCQRCTLIVSSLFEGVDEQDESVTLARYLDQMRGVVDDVLLKNRMGKAVINISANFDPTVGVVFIRELHKLLVELDGLNVAIVVSASNRANESPEIDRYPALFAKPGTDLYIPNLIVVGATDAHGHITDFSQYADWMTTFAPGDNIWIPLGDKDYMTSGGTSYSAPFVSGLIGYFRSLPSPWVNQLKDPGSVKKMIKIFHRRIVVSNEPLNVHKMKPIIWNGQVGEYSCLSDYRTVEQWDPRGYCPRIKLDLHEETNDGETVAPCRYDPVVLDNSLKRSDGSYCPRLPKTGPSGHTVSFTSNGRVKPSPTCASGTGCGGRLCTGFFCSPMPTGVPPDRHDPKDPNASSRVPTTTKPSDPEPTCDDKCKLDRGNRCSCGENGCDDQSPSCCANASCPYCECGENGCTPSSPWCCGNDSCEWSRTGGGGGNNPRPKPRTGFVLISVSSVENPVPPHIHHYWELWSDTPPKKVDLCKDDPLVKEKTDDIAGAFPPSLGPFTANGVTCKYIGDKKNAGKLECDTNVSKASCKAVDPIEKHECTLENPIKYLTVSCEWEAQELP
ncbi:glucan 1,3-beta-glucosidase [Paracoccidioides lutzii Pb01]|uniref:Glucan 1,3-beta-glucosidase n=1 Tax=Paracoccidioides lutzii (strain ATCC MYA-826 / Pb01) TaxID=502779 RepID=C1H5V3_PARBA|nr:glucan 1,3-beta-glucosidase [Paracoccidioides lutzii Pb01]EEH35016.2 glucan 1,3-beta-glucosidase [Paracoccidioides lutzii Pb01]